jgi:hypothetical protein
MAARQVHAGGHRFPPVTRGKLVWSFRAQLPVRAAVPPEGAFSAQTPSARPFSQPAPSPPKADVLRRERTTRHRHRPRSVTALLHPPSAGCLARLAVQGLGKLQPSHRTGWLAAIRCLDVGSLTAIPCRDAAGRTHSRDEAADLTATTGQAGTCWTSAKRLDSEASSSEPRHQTIGRRFPECSGWRQPRARDAGQRGWG